jgi:type II secretory pathway predicted ATPase ExeA/nucleoid-associated protein YgaU
MYYQHFGLSGAPFAFNPSSPVLFMSAGHREGLAALEWGLLEPSGFTMLVGEIGTGKTTLICSLLATRHQGVRTAWVANPRLSFEEMLRQLLGQLGVNQSARSGKLALLEAFDAQLARLGPEECIAVILDEAQDLSDDALEDLRLLSNFQSLAHRRLQIVLVGQIDLARRLAGPQMRQLNQRIGARALLPTLLRNEIHDYLDYRLRARGGDLERLFTRGAVRELTRASNGIPRRINVLCHNALLLAYAQGAERVSAQHMRDAAHDYDHLLVSRASAPMKMAAAASAAVRLAHETTRLAAGRFGRMATPAASIRPAMRAVAATAARGAAAAPTYVALCLLGLVLVGASQLRPVRIGFSALAARLVSLATSPRSPISTEQSQVQSKSGSDETRPAAPNRMGLAPLNAHDGSAANANEEIASGSANGFSMTRPAVPTERNLQPSTAANIKPVKVSSAGNIPASPETPVAEDRTVAGPVATVVVRAGDTLSKIALRLYGSLGTDELSRLTAANPQITNANLIYPGQSIRVQHASK